MTIIQSFIWCGLIALSTMNVALAATFRCYYDSMDNYLDTPISNTLGILPCLNKTRGTVIYTFGFNETSDSSTSIISALISLNKYNVVLLNWEEEAQSKLPKMLGYRLAVAFSKNVAQLAGEGVVQLIQKGTCPDSIQLIGFSLGAHLMGWMGEKVQSYGYNLSRIFGLDPAGPDFGTPNMKGLNPSQAKSVIGVHTNPGQYGIADSIGTIDFWVNCNNGTVQPGCHSGIYTSLALEGFCSHILSFEIFTESLLRNRGFWSMRADSCDCWTSRYSSPAVINYLGLDVDSGKTGNFYLSTNPQPPYAKGHAGIYPN